MAEARAAVSLYRKPSPARLRFTCGSETTTFPARRDSHGFLVLSATRAPILDMLPDTTDDARDTVREGGAQSPELLICTGIARCTAHNASQRARENAPLVLLSSALGSSGATRARSLCFIYMSCEVAISAECSWV